MIVGKKRGVEDQGQGLKYSFLFTTHLFSLFGIFIMDIHSFKKKNFFFFFKRAGSGVRLFENMAPSLVKLVKFRQITETLQALGFSWMK